MSKILRFSSFFAFMTALSLLGACSCGGGDDDDDASTDDTLGADDDAADDDVVDDDVADDDIVDDDTGTDDDTSIDDDTVTDDDTAQTQIVLDDGSAEASSRTICNECGIAQEFTPPVYPARLISASFYINSSSGLTRETKLVVYYSTSKYTAPAGDPVYLSAAFTFTTANAWNDIDLSGVAELDTLIASGDFYVGLQGIDALDTGPYIGVDYEGPGGYWGWTGSVWDGGTGCLMIRPTVQYLM